MTMATFITENISLGLGHSLRGIVHYGHGKGMAHGCMQAVSILEKQLKVLNQDW